MKNVGTIDRAVRLVLGVVGVGLVFFGPQTVWGWLGVVPLLTGAISFCPLYKIMGVCTIPNSKA